MVESRCGILCSECDYREKKNCGGCVHIIPIFMTNVDIEAE